MNRFTALYRLKWIFPLCLVALAVFFPSPNDGQEALEKPKPDEEAILHRMARPFHGDLKEVRKRRLIRVLVSYSKTNFFIDGGMKRGFEYELLKGVEAFLNKNIKRSYDKIHMVFIPVPFDQLIEALNDGRGDIAAAGLTITPEREEKVAFTRPYIPNIHEVAVLHGDVKDVRTLEDLSGRMVYVLSGSSYITHLKELNRKWARKGIRPVEIVEAAQDLETEDILELVNAGIVSATIADHHLAAAWAQVLPDITVRGDLSINSGGRIAWAVRKNSPQLLANLNTYLQKNKKGSLLGNILFLRYYQDSSRIKNPVKEKDRQKLETMFALFKKYADRYGFDWLAIAAQAYQESGLDQSKRSPAGAIGVMQILPATAADKSVGIENIHLLENNIHAGVKYLSFIKNRYFNKPEIPPDARVDFTWAAYNAGPAKVTRLRREAMERGFDPNKWFFHVEKIAAERIGRETIEYVSNIVKYYVAYKLYYEHSQEQRDALEGLTSVGAK